MLVEAHRAGGRALATLAVFRAPRPSRVRHRRGRRRAWWWASRRSPPHPASDLANAGIYAFDPAVLDRRRGRRPRDIGFHLLPGLVGRAGAVDLGDAFFMDIGTPEALERAPRTSGQARSSR